MEVKGAMVTYDRGGHGGYSQKTKRKAKGRLERELHDDEDKRN